MNTPVLELEHATRTAQSGEAGGFRGLSLAWQPGDLVLFEAVGGYALGGLADVLCGLVEAEEGVLRFEGRTWAERQPDEAAAARARIGRVFDGPGWINNLDVDENMTLAARYHRVWPEAEAYQQAASLARRLGLEEVPAGRPAHIATADLRRLQWVRALLGPRSLVLLERPLREVPADWVPPLLAEVARRRAEGLAVGWLQARGEFPAAELKPTLHFTVERGNILRT